MEYIFVNTKNDTKCLLQNMLCLLSGSGNKSWKNYLKGGARNIPCVKNGKI